MRTHRFKKILKIKLGMVLYACNLSRRRLRQEELQKQDNLVALLMCVFVCMNYFHQYRFLTSHIKIIHISEKESIHMLVNQLRE